MFPAKREDDMVDVKLKSFDRSGSTNLIRYHGDFNDSIRTWNDSPGHCKIVSSVCKSLKLFEINLPPSAQPPKKTAKKPLARRHF